MLFFWNLLEILKVNYILYEIESRNAPWQSDPLLKLCYSMQQI